MSDCLRLLGMLLLPFTKKETPIDSRADRRSRMRTAPITKEPEAPRYFSGNRASPLLVSDWTKRWSGPKGAGAFW